jgi:hypothetical protein
MRRYHYVAIVVFGLASGLSAQNPFEPETNAACIERLAIPSYSTSARQAEIEGTVTAPVVLSPRASVEWITTGFVSRTERIYGVLIESVENAIREATFRPHCAGKTVTLVFDFKIAGPSSDCPKQSAAFSYPNKFWIVTEPGKLKVQR